MGGLDDPGMDRDELRGKNDGIVDLKPSTSFQDRNLQGKWIKLPPSTSLVKEDKELLDECEIKDECLGASSGAKEKVERVVEKCEWGQVDTENDYTPSEVMTAVKKVPENGSADIDSATENTAQVASSSSRTSLSGRPKRKYQRRTYEVRRGSISATGLLIDPSRVFCY